MKKLVAFFPDDADVDFSSIANHSVEMHLTTVESVDSAKTSETESKTVAPSEDKKTGRVKTFGHIPEFKKPKGIRKKFEDRTTTSTIMEHFTPSGMFSRNQAEIWLSSVGYSRTSAKPALNKLRRSGNVRNLGGGKYQFVRDEKPSIRAVK